MYNSTWQFLFPLAVRRHITAQKSYPMKWRCNIDYCNLMLIYCQSQNVFVFEKRFLSKQNAIFLFIYFWDDYG